MARRWIPRISVTVFVGGIAGLIVSSIAGNNAGVVLTVGLCIVFAAVALITHAAVTSREPIEVFEEARAEQLEERIAALVAGGAPEHEVRALVRDAMRLGHR